MFAERTELGLGSYVLCATAIQPAPRAGHPSPVRALHAVEAAYHHDSSAIQAKALGASCCEALRASHRFRGFLFEGAFVMAAELRAVY